MCSVCPEWRAVDYRLLLYVSSTINSSSCCQVVAVPDRPTCTGCQTQNPLVIDITTIVSQRASSHLHLLKHSWDKPGWSQKGRSCILLVNLSMCVDWVSVNMCELLCVYVLDNQVEDFSFLGKISTSVSVNSNESYIVKIKLVRNKGFGCAHQEVCLPRGLRSKD